jgi:hypothetical protein
LGCYLSIGMDCFHTESCLLSTVLRLVGARFYIATSVDLLSETVSTIFVNSK